MSDSPIFDQLVAEFAAERKIRYESLLTPAPQPPVFYPERSVRKPGAVRKTDKSVFHIEGANPVVTLAMSIVDEEFEKARKDPSEGSRMVGFPEVTTLFDKYPKTPYRTEKAPYVGEDTQEIDVTLLQTSKTLQPLEG